MFFSRLVCLLKTLALPWRVPSPPGTQVRELVALRSVLGKTGELAVGTPRGAGSLGPTLQGAGVPPAAGKAGVPAAGAAAAGGDHGSAAVSAGAAAEMGSAAPAAAATEGLALQAPGEVGVVTPGVVVVTPRQSDRPSAGRGARAQPAIPQALLPAAGGTAVSSAPGQRA